MPPIFIVLIAIVGLPILVLISLIINVKRASPIAEQKYKELTQEEKELKAKETMSFSFTLASYFSKRKLSNLMLINICKKQIKEGLIDEKYM